MWPLHRIRKGSAEYENSARWYTVEEIEATVCKKSVLLECKMSWNVLKEVSKLRLSQSLFKLCRPVG